MQANLVIHCPIESQTISNLSQLRSYFVIWNFASACVSQNASIVSLLNLSSGTQMRWFRSNALRRAISSASRAIFVALKFSSTRLHLEVFGITAIPSWSRKPMQIWNVQQKKASIFLVALQHVTNGKTDKLSTKLLGNKNKDYSTVHLFQLHCKSHMLHVNVKWNRRLVWYNHYHHESTKLYQKKITRLLLLALYFRLLATTFASHADLSAVTLFTYSVLPWSTVAGYHMTCKTCTCYIISWLSTYEEVHVTRPFFWMDLEMRLFLKLPWSNPFFTL